MSLPPSFSYYVSRLQGAMVRNTVKITPKGSSTVKMNSQMEFELPSDSILDLTTATFRGKFKYQNAVGGVNGVRAVPQTHTLWRNVQWALNNQVVSGNNTAGQWGRLYEILRRCIGSETHENANVDEYRKVPVAKAGVLEGSEVATNSIAQLVAFDDWRGLASSPNACNLDSALVGNVKLRIETAGTEICYGYADSGTNNYDWELTDCELTVDVITFMGDNAYDAVMSELIGSGQELYMPFQEAYIDIQASNSNYRFNVATSCLDVIGFAPLASEGLSATQMTSTSGTVAATAVEYGPRALQFRQYNSSNSLPDENSSAETYFFNINQRVYPQFGAEAISRGVQHTKDCFAPSKDYDATNLLFKGNFADDGGDTLTNGETFNRRNNVALNCIIAHKLCLDSPAHQSHFLSGLNTQGQSSTISLNTTGCSTADYTLVFALTSAVLAVGQGQAVSVVY